MIGIQGPGWLTDPSWALYSVALVDVWKGVGLATVIYIAGLLSIPTEYYEASKVDGSTGWQRFWHITLPLSQPATTSVIILSLIGGLRSFDLIWAMTGGGPGFTSDVIASVIYKQYQAGFYGLSTAGNVILFLIVTVVVMPLFMLLNRKARLMRTVPRQADRDHASVYRAREREPSRTTGSVPSHLSSPWCSCCRSHSSSSLRSRTHRSAALLELLWPDQWQLVANFREVLSRATTS